MSLFDQMIRYGMPLVPKPIVGMVSRRYVAGETIEHAAAKIKKINAEGAMATVDVLGESVTRREKADSAVEEYLNAMQVIEDQALDANVSVKPTLLGLNIDEEFCQERIDIIVRRAKELKTFVRIDMEDHPTTDATLRIFKEMHRRHGNVGVALQAYMRRLVSDINDLLPLKPNIRLCKGIYREPRAISWKAFETIRENFTYCLDKLLSGDAYVGIATHDAHLVWAATAIIDRLQLDPEKYEFQMLLGVDPDLRRIILDHGHRLRVYVPYGPDWYPYAIRRLRENPTVARHVIRAMLGRSPQ